MPGDHVKGAMVLLALEELAAKLSFMLGLVL